MRELTSKTEVEEPVGMTPWAQQPEFDSWNLHGVRKEPTPSDLHVHAVVRARLRTHTHTEMYRQFFTRMERHTETIWVSFLFLPTLLIASTLVVCTKEPFFISNS